MNFKLKNYTTEIAAKRSIAEIEIFLSALGAGKIMKELHGDGRIRALTFSIVVDSREIVFQLPANSDQVYEVLRAGYKNPHRVSRQKLQERAENVCWRIIKDWLYAQLSLIKIGQAKVEQVMLPYMYNGQKTLYELIKDSGFKFAQLEAPKSKKED